MLYKVARHPGEVFYMFVCHVCLGVPARIFDGERALEGDDVWAPARGKARRRELAVVPGSKPPMHFHGQLVEVTPSACTSLFHHGARLAERYPEFVIAHSDRAYPEYLLAVHRGVNACIYIYMYA